MSGDFYYHPGLRPLRRALLREKWWQLFAGIGLMVLSLWVIKQYFSVQTWLVVLGTIMAYLGLRLTIAVWPQLNIDEHPLLVLLREQPDRVVWCYTMEIERRPFGLTLFSNGILYCKLDDGDEISVPLPPRYLRLVARTLQRLLPHAAFGYSAERAARYKQNPGKFGNTNLL